MLSVIVLIVALFLFLSFVPIAQNGSGVYEKICRFVFLWSGVSLFKVPQVRNISSRSFTPMIITVVIGKIKKNEFGMAARRTLVEEIRAEVLAKKGHVLLLSGGDVNTGTPESDLFLAEPDFKGMRLLGYDAMAVGNHEFDNSYQTILSQQSEAGFPFLSANIFFGTGTKRGELAFQDVMF